MTRKELNPFSDEALAQILESLDWQYYGDEAKQFIKIKNLPLLVGFFVYGVPKFRLNGYNYELTYGIFTRTGEKIKAKPKDIGEEIAYYADKVPVFFKDIKAKMGIGN